MALPHSSIATISSPEFINLTPLDINPLMSSCQIKVLYLGANRNRTYISKQTALSMAKTLRGAPIVGYYKENKEDFADHGEQVIFDDEGVHFKNNTKPYGFVAPDAKVWFQDFQEKDDFENQIIRTYLMTTGYLWTGQYEEARLPLEDAGRPQSMQFDSETLDGHWSTDINKNIEFFIINDAIFSKLCILGNDVEPCFEGSSITEPEVSKNFSLDNDFKKTLFTMMQDLKYALEGEKQMADLENKLENQENIVEEEATSSLENVEETFSKNEDNVNESSQAENEVIVESENSESSFAKKEEDQEESGNTSESEEQPEEQDEDDKKKYSLLEKEYNTLQDRYNLLEEEVKSLRQFKLQIDNERKDALIAEFYMLDEADKADVIANKENYTLDEIKAKLSVICFEKKVNFGLQESSENDNKEEKESITTFNLNVDDSTPDWVRAVEEVQKNKF